MRGRVFFGIALFLSLALNVFFIGGMAHHAGMQGSHHRSPSERMLENAEQLAEPTQTDVKVIINGYRPQFEAQMQRMKESREKLNALMKSSDYTRAKADAQFEAMQAEMGKMQDIAKKMILDVNEKLTPEQRLQMMPFRDGPGGRDDTSRNRN